MAPSDVPPPRAADNPGHPAPKGLLADALYFFGYALTTALLGCLFPVRVSGLKRGTIPWRGAVLLLANHQSYLDPVLVGWAAIRPLRYLARASLFAFPPLRWLIVALGALPLRRDVGVDGLKASLRCLAAEEALLLFPEGTRTRDGSVGPAKPGVLLLLRRQKATVVLVGIAGAYTSWPRSRWLPLPSPIWLHFERWEYDRSLSDDDNLAALSAGLVRVHAIADRARRRI